jgi:hypothetical protein
MLNPGVLQFASTGRIRNASATPTDFNGGTPTVQGLLAFSITSPQVVSGGFGYRDNGSISVALNGAPSHYIGGLPVNALGQLCCTQGVIEPVLWVSGIPLGIDGLVALAVEETPVLTSEFSNAFDQQEFN